MVKRPTPIYNVAKLVLFAQRFDHHGLHQERYYFFFLRYMNHLHDTKFNCSPNTDATA